MALQILEWRRPNGLWKVRIQEKKIAECGSRRSGSQAPRPKKKTLSEVAAGSHEEQHGNREHEIHA